MTETCWSTSHFSPPHQPPKLCCTCSSARRDDKNGLKKWVTGPRQGRHKDHLHPYCLTWLNRITTFLSHPPVRYVKDGGNSRGERKTAVCCVQAVRGYFENYYESRCQVTSSSQRSSCRRENEKIQAMFPRVSLCFVSLLPQRWSRAVLVSLFTRLHDPVSSCLIF